MAPLSHQLAGVVLEHEYYGSHLDSSGKTIDVAKEKENFRYAGEVLCDLWNGLEIDNFPVHSTYVDPDTIYTDNVAEIDHLWNAKHVRSSQYLLQIVKCNDKSCCGEFRNNIGSLLPDRFLPPPLKVKPSEKGFLEPANIRDKTGKFLPLFTQLSVKLENVAPGMIKVIFYKVKKIYQSEYCDYIYLKHIFFCR